MDRCIPSEGKLNNKEFQRAGHAPGNPRWGVDNLGLYGMASGFAAAACAVAAPRCRRTAAS